MTQTTHPDKAKVREVMQKHRQEHKPPMSPEQFKREIGWAMLHKERK
jgi:hypothetical protein